MFTPQFLAQAFPSATQDRLDAFYQPLVDTCLHYNITTNLCIAAFLANVGEESEEFKYVEENLMYSWQGLRRIFPKYFDSDDIAQKYAKNPQAIASRVYANRMGNGSEASGEGWTYRGRGLLQITGKTNYGALQAILGGDLVGSPDLLSQPGWAALSAGAFWDQRGLNIIASTGDFRKVCMTINGGLIGFQERQDLYGRILELLGV